MKKKHANALFVSLGFALLCAFLSWFAPRFPAMVENVYSRGIYSFFASIASTLCAILPVSLSELLLLVGLPLLLYAGINALVKRMISVRGLISFVLTLVFSLYSIFTLGWALNYHRLPYAQTAGIQIESVEISVLEKVCIDLAHQAGTLRAALDTADAPITLPYTQSQVTRQVNAAYTTASCTMPWLGGHFGAPKIAMLSLPLAYLNIAGIFSPFTIEAHVNAFESDVLLGATAAHEAAHLRGFAREDEANFIAYQVCMSSTDPYLMYSGTMLALLYAGNALYEADPNRYTALRALYTLSVAADFTAYNRNWKPFEGKAAQVHEQLNDAYLKFNQQTDGVRSYGRMVDLLIAQWKKDKLSQ